MLNKTLFVLLFIFCASFLKAQAWVEYNPGTCTVGPPPFCVVGHWHQVEIPSSPQAKTAASKKTGVAAPGTVSEISSDLEYQSYTYSFSGTSIGGSSIGLRAMYEQTVPSLNADIGGRLSYETYTIEKANNKPSNINFALYGTRQLTDAIQVGAGLNYMNYNSDSKGVDPLTSTGVYANGTYTYVFSPKFYLLGGAILNIASTSGSASNGDKTLTSLNFGLNGFYNYSDDLIYSGEIFRITGGLLVYGIYGSKMFSDVFGMTLGLKTLTGLENFSNTKITLGGSYRY